jgi:bifunctional DNase/RNase
MRKQNKILPKLFGAFSIIVVLTVIGIAANQYYSLDGYTKVWPGGVLEVIESTLIIGDNCTAIIADTTDERALGIADAIMNTSIPRPDTWTSWEASLKSFNITVDAVQMQRYDGKYYYADVLLRGMTDQEKVLRLDMRPSDAIALALRSGAPIYVNTTLLKEVGKNICE